MWEVDVAGRCGRRILDFGLTPQATYCATAHLTSRRLRRRRAREHVERDSGDPPPPERRPLQLQVLHGHAAWAAGQLEGEIRAGAWHWVPGAGALHTLHTLHALHASGPWHGCGSPPASRCGGVAPSPVCDASGAVAVAASATTAPASYNYAHNSPEVTRLEAIGAARAHRLTPAAPPPTAHNFVLDGDHATAWARAYRHCVEARPGLAQ